MINVETADRPTAALTASLYSCTLWVKAKHFCPLNITSYMLVWWWNEACNCFALTCAGLTSQRHFNKTNCHHNVSCYTAAMQELCVIMCCYDCCCNCVCFRSLLSSLCIITCCWCSVFDYFCNCLCFYIGIDWLYVPKHSEIRRINCSITLFLLYLSKALKVNWIMNVLLSS